MSTEKRRQALYVSVPSVFRCPISMDVMKSPVSLCTGVTYDRSSIEKWLSLGHNTCPATMQPLPSNHTTPNLTLRRLIRLWLSTDAHSFSAKEISRQEALAAAESDVIGVDALAKIVQFMKVSEENLKLVLKSTDVVPRIVDEVLAESVDIKACETAVQILDLIAAENGVKERLNGLILKRDGNKDCLSTFISLLRKGSLESKSRSARLLELIAINSDSQRKIAEKEGLLYELYNLISVETDSSTVEAGLSALTALSTSRQVKKELIRFGVVKAVGKILSADNFPGTLVEKASGILELVATCTEGRSAISEDEECVVGIVKRLMKCSRAATEHGITVLWSVCCLARERGAQEKVGKVNGLTKVLLVMQSDCSEGTRQMCGELVKVLRVKSTKSYLASYDTRTTHIMPY